MSVNRAPWIFKDLQDLIQECQTSLEEACCMDPQVSISFSLKSETAGDMENYSIRIDRNAEGCPVSDYATEDKVTVSFLSDWKLKVRFYLEMVEQEPSLIGGVRPEEWSRTLKRIRNFCLRSISL